MGDVELRENVPAGFEEELRNVLNREIQDLFISHLAIVLFDLTQLLVRVLSLMFHDFI
jgi:hypothetical protein